MKTAKDKLYQLIGEMVVETRIIKANYCCDGDTVNKTELSEDMDIILKNAAELVRGILSDLENLPDNAV